MKLQRYIRENLDLIVLLIVFASTGWNYYLYKTTGAGSWRVAFVSVALCLFLYAFSRVRTSSWPSMALMAVFTIEFIGVLLGFNLSTKAFPETILISCLIGLGVWLSDKFKIRERRSRENI